MPKDPSSVPPIATRRLKRPLPTDYLARVGASKPSTPPKRNSPEWTDAVNKSSHVITYRGRSHTFSVKDDVLILGHDMCNTKEYEHHEFWVGRIEEIRSEKLDDDHVWALVRWYWSGTDIHNECKQLDTSSFGKYERCLSEYRDIVDILCINGRAKVLHYKDEAPDQQIATSNQTFYVRRAFDFAKSPPIFHVGSCKLAWVYTYETPYVFHVLQPMPALHCICKKPYNPDKSGTMYYCPKPSCKTWWHTACLDAQQAVHEGCDQEEQWHIHLGELLNSSFDLDEQFMSMLDSHDPEQRASLREKSFITPAMLTHIPKDIVDAAQHQIRRGGDFGVVGNVRIVTRARQFVARYYRAIWGNNLGFDQQVKTLQQEIDETKVLRMVGADRQKAVDSPGKPYYCPDCSGPL